MLKHTWRNQHHYYSNDFKIGFQNILDMHKIFILQFLLFVSTPLLAQRPPALSSPDVHADRSITFRYFSKNAQRVTLEGEFLAKAMKMVKDSEGIWSVTVPPVEPDIYPYSFWVDSVQTADPNNTEIFANERFKRNLVDIPGEKPLIHALQNVPHGKINYRYYKSATL